MQNSLLLLLKMVALHLFSRPSVQTLDINYLPPLAPISRYRERLTQTPKDQPGLVLPLPRECGVCHSFLLGYDRLNIVTCDSCGSILSRSGRWHNTWLGNIKPLTEEDRARARELLKGPNTAADLSDGGDC